MLRKTNTKKQAMGGQEAQCLILLIKDLLKLETLEEVKTLKEPEIENEVKGTEEQGKETEATEIEETETGETETETEETEKGIDPETETVTEELLTSEERLGGINRPLVTTDNDELRILENTQLPFSAW